MASKVEIGHTLEVANFISKYAEKLVTPEGKEYYRFPFWFEKVLGDFEFVMHIDMPEDLSMCICKARLGGNGIEIKKPEL